MFRMTSDLPDKERILTYLLWQIQSSILLALPFNAQEHMRERCKEKEWLYFEHIDYRDVKAGDLVMCQTSGIHAFTIGYVVDKFNHDWQGCRIREIGSERLCNMSNESYIAIRGLDEPWSWEGPRYVFYRKVGKAFRKLDDWYRYGGMKFNDDGTVTITIREKFGGMVRGDQESVPFDVTMAWTPKMRIKHIIQSLKDGGVGTRKFERRPTNKPDSGGARVMIEM